MPDQAKIGQSIVPLLEASEKGDLEKVKYSLSKGANIEARLDSRSLSIKGGWEATPLILASKQGHEHIVKYLLEKGANVNNSTRIGLTPIYIASEKGHFNVVKLLIEYGSEINRELACGFDTPATLALKNKHFKLMEFLMLYGGYVTIDEYEYILHTDDLKKLSQKEKLELHQKILRHTQKLSLSSHLIKAVKEGNLNKVKSLVQQGAIIHVTRVKQESTIDGLLFIAVEKSNYNLVKYLIDNGIRLNTKTYQNKTPLDLATDPKIRELLIKHGAKSGKKIK